MTREALTTSDLGIGQEHDPDADLYASACISCHYNSGPVPLSARPELALSSALTLPEPTNFIQAVLRGVGDREGAPGSSLSDAEIARLGAYLRRIGQVVVQWRARLSQKQGQRLPMPHYVFDRLA